jgi:drug/metabolite transporter (DMT)-like permease
MAGDPATVAEEQPLADTRVGIACTMSSTVCFAGLDTGVKYLSAFYPVLEIAWARYLFQIALLPFIIRGARLRDLVRTRRPGLQILRSILQVGASLTFFTAVRTMPVADASSIGMVAPLLITVLAIPFLGEKVGARRWTAVSIGLVGALIIIRPVPACSALSLCCRWPALPAMRSIRSPPACWRMSIRQ